MIVKVKKLNDKAVVPFKKYDSDFCYDCVAVSEEEIAPNVWKYGLGLAFEIEKDPYDPKNILNFGVSIRPRSSVWKTGMVLSNCEGTIDQDYRGEISAVFYHVMPDMPRYKVGDKICQLYFDICEKIDFEVVDELTHTDRGEGGFGSTGI